MLYSVLYSYLIVFNIFIFFKLWVLFLYHPSNSWIWNAQQLGYFESTLLPNLVKIYIFFLSFIERCFPFCLILWKFLTSSDSSKNPINASLSKLGMQPTGCSILLKSSSVSKMVICLFISNMFLWTLLPSQMTRGVRYWFKSLNSLLSLSFSLNASLFVL